MPSVLNPILHVLSPDNALPLLLTTTTGDLVCILTGPLDYPLKDRNDSSTSCTPLLNTPQNSQEPLAKELPSSSQVLPLMLPAWHSICHPQAAYSSNPRHNHQPSSSMNWTNSPSRVSHLYREIPPQRWTPSPTTPSRTSSSSTDTSLTSDWLNEWDNQPKPGVLLQAIEPQDDHKLAILVSQSDTLVTCLCTLLFDSKFTFHTAYTAWRADVTCCDYGLSPYLLPD